MTTKDQRPSGGCDNCGGPVRTRKSNGWVCAACERGLNREHRKRDYHPVPSWGERGPQTQAEYDS